MDIELAIMRMGLTSMTQNITVSLDGSSEQKLGGQLQTDVGLIYGWNIWADGVTPDNLPLITTTNAQNLYVSLAKGAQTTIFPLRLDDMLNVYAGSPVIRTQKYLPLIIRWNEISLDRSFISNPLGIGADAEEPPIVWFNFHYLSMDDYNELLQRGPEFGIASTETTTGIKSCVQQETEDAGQVVPIALRAGKK